nr:MAG TPA: hypothetical protein [Caudoviricetes sp.]
MADVVPKVATCATFNSPRSSLIFFKTIGLLDGARSRSISHKIGLSL